LIFIFAPLHEKIHFDIIAPVPDSIRNLNIAVVFRIDPDDFLYPITNEWQSTSYSGESYLVKKLHDEVTILTTLRHIDNSELSLSIPLDRQDATEVNAVLGHEGLFEGIDYRGVSVFSDIKKVPGTSWYIISKIDTEELYADLNLQAFWVFSTVILIILLFVGAVSLFYNRRQKNFYKEVLQQRSELFQTQEEYRTILYSIGDGVITTDKDGFVNYLNPVAERLTGWKEMDAAKRQVGEVFRIVHETTREEVECPIYEVLQTRTEGGLYKNVVLLSADGRETPVEDSCSPIMDSQGNLSGAIMVFSDQTKERMRRRMTDLRLKIFEYSISHNMAETLTKILDEIGTLFQSPAGFFYFLLPDQDTFQLKSWSTQTLIDFTVDELEYLHGEKVVSGSIIEVLHSKQPIVLDYAKSPNGNAKAPKEEKKLNREIITPVIRNSKAVAILGVGNRPTEYTEDDKEMLGFLADVLWEIADHKLNEIKLKESEEKMRSIFRVAPTGIGIVKRRIITEMNPFLCEMVGYEASELIGQNSTILYPSRNEYERVGIEKYRQISLYGSGTIETKWQKKDGTVIDVLLSSTMVDVADETKGFTFTALDITARKEAEKKVKEHERQLASMVSNLPGFVYRCRYNADWTMLYLSDSVKNITGYPSSAFIMDKHSTFNNIIREQYHSAINQEWERVIKNKTFFQMEYEIITATRQIKWVLERGVGVYDETGNLMFLEGYIEDITDRKMHDKELLQAKEKAEESDRLKSAFLANMSHEIRTPMNGILGFMQLLKEPGLSEDQMAEYIDIVNKSGNRLMDTINDIIEISKIESGEAKIVMSDFNCEDLMNYQHVFFKPQADQKNLEFEIASQLTGDSAIIRMDKYKLISILNNLIRNAIKFTDSGSIVFGNYVEEDFLHFYVQDTGRGISAERIPYIFDRFVQAEIGLSRSHEGSGLGLSICKAHIESLGGKIFVESEVGKGSVFHFTIPYDPVKADNTSGTEKKNAQEPVQTNKIILVVEDDENSCKYLLSLLSRMNLRPVHVNNGSDAINVLTINPEISLVLMDLKMPVMDGLQTTSEIRKFNKTIPIIAQSAYALPGKQEMAIEAGCDGYITKPIKREELTRIINKYLKNEKSSGLARE
jgi:PAS domain S-box-containing protein